MGRHTQPRPVERRKHIAIRKLARSGMSARQIAKRTGEHVEAVRHVIAAMEQEQPWNQDRSANS